MAKGKKEIEYKQRLKELKIKLRPYRNKHTVNLLRVITGSSGVRLNNHWEALESVLDGSHSPHVVQTRIQSVVNMITDNREKNITKASHSNSIGHNIVMKEFERFNFNNKTNVLGDVRHVEEIDSKANVLGDVTHGHITSKASVFDNFRHSDIDSKANVFGNMTHGNIASKASVFDNFRHSDIDSKANVTHGNIGSNSNVGQGTIHLEANTINRLQHLHIGSCSPDCYKRL